MSKRYEPKYWNEKGKYQKLYKSLFAELVPHVGNADTQAGEVLRCVSKLYHDIFNNGGWNFDVLKRERLRLLLLVPKNAKDSTKRFIDPPPDDWQTNNNYMKFLDKYVDWAILYADALKSMDKLEKKLP